MRYLKMRRKTGWWTPSFCFLFISSTHRQHVQSISLLVWFVPPKQHLIHTPHFAIPSPPFDKGLTLQSQSHWLTYWVLPLFHFRFNHPELLNRPLCLLQYMSALCIVDKRQTWRDEWFVSMFLTEPSPSLRRNMRRNSWRPSSWGTNSVKKRRSNCRSCWRGWVSCTKLTESTLKKLQAS